MNICQTDAQDTQLLLTRLVQKFSLRSYCLPRCVVDRWLLGNDNPKEAIEELKQQNMRDWPRMKIREWRTIAQCISDRYKKLQYTIYPNQAIWVIPFSKIQQAVLKLQAEYHKHNNNTKHKELLLLQDPSALECDFFPNGKLIMKKAFCVKEYQPQKGNLSDTILFISATIKITDLQVHFAFSSNPQL